MIDQLTPLRLAADGDGPGAATAEQPSRRRALVLAVMAAVVAVDQITKWWAWRHLADAVINPGGTGFLGTTFGSLFSRPATGALLDVLDSGVLALLAAALVHHLRSHVALGSAAVMVGGWGSNLLDRLGLHDVTAPGSLRGAVDFLPLGGYFYNLADLCIATGTGVFLSAAIRGLLRQPAHPSVPRILPADARRVPFGLRRSRPVRVRRTAMAAGLAVLAAAVLVAVVVGATHDSGIQSPGVSASASLPRAGSPR